MFPSGGDRVRPTDTPPAFYEADSQQSQYEKPQGMAMSRSDEERDGEAIAQEEYSSISVSQKMISATWGSILTSLLVTPLDVVRIRLQSQTPVIRVPIPSSNLFKQLPPNLGVSACCREVFWIGDNAQFCMVGQHNVGNPGFSNPNVGGSQTNFRAHGGGGGGSGGAVAAAECAVEETQRKSFTSTLDGLRKIARNEGAQSLWRGLSPTLIMAIPANVIYFTGYDWLRYDERSPIARHVEFNSIPFVAGSVARVAAASVISPIEMFRTRLQATSGRGTDHFKATLRGLHQMTQTHGYSSLWRGLTLTMWRDVPFSGLYWLGYEAIKDSFAEMRIRALTASGIALSPDQSTAAAAAAAQETNTTVFLESFAAGAVSGAVAALITTPFDVGKTRQQVFHHAGDGAGKSGGSLINSFSSSSFSFLKKKHTSTTSNTNTNTNTNNGTNTAPTKSGKTSIPRFLMQIFREEGTAGLFRGWAARCLKVAPACAIMISSYEIGKRMAGQANERREADV